MCKLLKNNLIRILRFQCATIASSAFKNQKTWWWKTTRMKLNCKNLIFWWWQCWRLYNTTITFSNLTYMHVCMSDIFAFYLLFNRVFSWHQFANFMNQLNWSKLWYTKYFISIRYNFANDNIELDDRIHYLISLSNTMSLFNFDCCIALD